MKLAPLFAEFRPMLRLAVPLVLAEVGWMAMGIVDTVMVGRLPDSAEAIGAVSLGSVMFYTITIYFGCIFLGLDTMVSQAFGAGNLAECHRALWSALHLAVPLAVLSVAANWLAAESLGRLGVNPAILQRASEYMQLLGWSAVPLLFYFALRRYVQGLGIVQPITFSLITANVINLVGNWALIYGHLGFPAMGTAGSAWSTVIARIYMLVVLAAYVIYHNRRARLGLFAVNLWPEWATIRRLLSLGMPAATHVLLEIAVFGIATVLIARLDAVSLAAHQIALNAASMSFMVPLGISSAAAVRVGHAIGRGDWEGAARSGWAALALGTSFMACAAIAFLTIPGAIARSTSPSPEVIAMSISLLAVAAVFQLFDALQIIASGALRGAGDTRTPMICNLVFYWFVGLPTGYILCFKYKMGAIGLWIGLCTGLVLIGCALLVAWKRTTTREIHAQVLRNQPVA